MGKINLIIAGLMIFGASLSYGETVRTPYDRQANRIIDTMNECAGNGNGNLYGIDIKKLNARSFIEKLIEQERGCFRQFSRSKSEGIDLLQKFLNGRLGGVSEDVYEYCIKEEGLKDTVKEVQRLVHSRKVKAVFANLHDDREPNSEACAVYEFHIVKTNGVVIRLEFNFTD